MRTFILVLTGAAVGVWAETFGAAVWYVLAVTIGWLLGDRIWQRWGRR